MSTQSSPITIRPLRSFEDCYHFQETQHRVWAGEPDREIVPIHVLITQIKNGGMVWGAFAPDGPEATGGMVGLAFGWPGLAQVEGRQQIKFCSHMLGVLPSWQGRGVGLRLKLAQRDYLLAEGLTDWMTWTYDPLQRVNAAFNIHRLGATCATYIRNLYGEMQDHLNAGMPSDRFQVDWRVCSERVESALSAQPPQVDWTTIPLQILPSRRLNVGSHVYAPVDSRLSLDGRALAVPLPHSVASLRVEGSLLMDWRLFLRHAIEESLTAGYTVVDCVELRDRGWYYILTPPGLRPFVNVPWP
jgi:predicted GNAT superfamily acetyltransferase